MTRWRLALLIVVIVSILTAAGVLLIERSTGPCHGAKHCIIDR